MASKQDDLPAKLRSAADAMLSERIDRLVAAQEAQTNALTKLLQVMRDEQDRKRTRKNKARRPVIEKAPRVEATPMVKAQVARALARFAR
jgi:hypothetical protein